ncbi:DUF1285 domain-containing protein [Spongorhabdus nitratireducens]
MTRQSVNPQSLAATAQQHGKRGLPPVHDWNPAFCGDIDIHIKRDGSWDYMGTPISRESMVRLFSTILRRDPDDAYYLVTPVEKVRIRVDDVPFIITGFEVTGSGEKQQLVMTTNVSDEVVLNTENPLRIEQTSNGENLPYINVRDRLDARLHRNVFYQLVEMAEEQQLQDKTLLGIYSGGQFHSLGELP